MVVLHIQFYFYIFIEPKTYNQLKLPVRLITLSLNCFSSKIFPNMIISNLISLDLVFQFNLKGSTNSKQLQNAISLHYFFQTIGKSCEFVKAN